ncbi:hypothetical protein BDY19DRAFT_868536, partial [Irpex rosettiformis]
VTPSATSTLTMRLLPYPPPGKPTDWNTIRTQPDLFVVTTPIHINIFQDLLVDHPNRPLVNSVLHGLRHGFWPFAEQPDSFPDVWDAGNPPLDDPATNFIRDYVNTEELASRYSRSFGQDLLPGMYSMPIHVIPKPNSDKLCLINDHSTTKYSLNDMICRDDVGMRQDNVLDLGENLLHFRASNPHAPVWLFKSDVFNAYRLLPMHPLWQLKQVITVDGHRRIDRCCCFGSRGSPDLWCTFMALVLWIAVYKRNISGLLAYMDDNFALDEDLCLRWYEPYQTWLPAKQVALLQLWDELGILHRREKQLYGEQLIIIAFSVDPVRMTISLPHHACSDLVSAIRDFVLNSNNRRRTLRKWQRILGWINWGLNVQPLLRPALQSSYDKIAGRHFASAPIYLNKRSSHDLLWIAGMFERQDSVHMITASTWTPADADLVIYCDACLSGLGFWSPLAPSFAFAADRPVAPTSVEDNIFWFEALTILTALHCAITLPGTFARVAIFTDNLNTVQMFDSFRSREPYLDILLAACEILITHHVELHVWHIPGERNTIADALSRRLFAVVHQYAPTLSITSFEPPRPTRLAWTHERLVHERAIALGYAIDDSTHSAYTSHIQSYLTFVKLHNLPIEPTTDTLSLYTVYMCHHIKPTSVDCYLSGICNKLEPFFPTIRSTRKSPLVARTLAGCKRKLSAPTSRKRPLGVEDIKKCLASFSSPSYDNRLFCALLLAGFLGLHRLGELVRPSKGAAWRKTISHTSASLDQHSRLFQYTLPTSKTDHLFEGSKIILGD